MVTGENVPNTKENLIDKEVSHDYALRPEQELRFEVSFRHFFLPIFAIFPNFPENLDLKTVKLHLSVI